MRRLLASGLALVTALPLSAHGEAASRRQLDKPVGTQSAPAPLSRPAYPIQCSVTGGGLDASQSVDLPAPTPDQLRAYDLLKSEAGRFESDARDYQKRLTAIVRHHYEEQRRRILASLDQEIGVEKAGLESAREEAIVRLERFVAAYSGAKADPQATPDAMFRLAALYEERARADMDADLAQALDPAIGLYVRVAEEFPAYKELAAVLYYLGHALYEATRLDEAQQAFRALVCANRYQVRRAASGGAGVQMSPLSQDHDDGFWNEWYNKNPIPLDQMGKRPDEAAFGFLEAELKFVDPYAGCVAVSQEVPPDAEPRYVAESWWQIGNYHFDQLSEAGGPYELNRAASAYQNSLAFKRPPLHGVALYKQAWTLYKQQRYEAAVRRFVDLLHYADEEEAKTGDPGADFRNEAYTYIAGSLTYVDFAGPPDFDPFIARSDALDLERDPLVAEEKMAIALTRVADSNLIPQDRRWTVEIYKALAQEFLELNQNRNAIAALELAYQRFPLDREAPVMVSRVAELYDQQMAQAPEGAAVRAEYAAKALAARTELSKFVGSTPWTEAHHDDPEALSQAEDLVRTGLQRAAADHTNFARAFKDKAVASGDPGTQRELLAKAIAEYQLAASGWSGYLEQDKAAPDAYETRFWLADALFWSTVLPIPLGQLPSAEQVESARSAAATVRDSNEDDRYEQPAAYYVVTLAEKVLEGLGTAYTESSGSRGVAKREEVEFEGSGSARKPLKIPLPHEVEAAVCARDEYNARIPLTSDPAKNGLMYATQAAEYFFVYGQFDEARRRLEPIYKQYCGKNEWGYNAWEKLISMSNFEGDADRSRALAEASSCAIDEETRAKEEAIRLPVRQGVAYMAARKLFEEAMGMKDGPERRKKWLEAAAAYQVALETAPDRDDAPEAAMNSAYSYKQVGEYEKATNAYRLFIEKYGDEATLLQLKKGDPEKYKVRLGYVADAYRAMAGAYILFFDYPHAAQVFDTISSHSQFDRDTKKDAARQALTLHANLDDRNGMERSRRTFSEIAGTDEARAEAAFIVASASLKRWDPESKDNGANKQARLQAQNSMEQYFTSYRGKRGAERFVVRAAYNVARSLEIGRSPDAKLWWGKTISSYDAFASAAPKSGKSAAAGTEEASMAAEGDYRLLDAQIAAGFDYETGHHRFAGTIVEVVGQYGKDAAQAKEYFSKLGAMVEKYASQKWAAVAIARQASLYDSLRTGLYNTRPPALKMFTPQQERALKLAEESDNDDLIDKADQIRTTVNDAWRTKRDTELDGADRIVVDRYSTAVLLARRYNLSDPSITRAIRRLAFLSDVVGEAKMAEYTASIRDLGYQPGMFQRMRPGIVEHPESGVYPPPSPVPPAGGPAPTIASAARKPYQDGLAAFNRGNISGAKAQLERASSADPKSALPPYALGAIAERTRDLKGAIVAYKRALDREPSFHAARAAWALALGRGGDMKGAEELLNKGLAASKDSMLLQSALAELRSMQGHSGEAQEQAQAVLKKDTANQAAMVTLARDHYRARRIDLALYTLEGIVDGYGEGNPARDKDNAEALLLRGLIFAERRLKGPATDDLLRAVALRPDLVEARAALGAFYLEAGNAKDAVPHLEAAVRFDSRNPGLHAALGDAYRLLDRPADARRELEWVLKAAPTSTAPYYTLGLVYLMSQSIPGVSNKEAADKAISYFEEFKKRVPRGGPDDVDEMITRAKTKRALAETEGGKG